MQIVDDNVFANGTDPQPALSLSFSPHAGLLTPTREFVSLFCSSFLRDPDMVSRIAMTVHELLENAIKYSLDGKAQVHLEVRREQAATRFLIRTENRASAEGIVAAGAMIRNIRAAADPFALYCDLMAASVERTDTSGLGLARIRAEGGLQIDSHVVGDRVSVCAQAIIEQGGLL